MPENMLSFVSRPRETPEKRGAIDRRRDFEEIYRPFAEAAAAAQASRCSQCGVPFCAHACPLGNDIPAWLRLVAEGRLEEAYRRSAATNAMPEVCGKICPQDRLCEGACVIEKSGHGTVTIGAIETFITETAFEEGWARPIAPARELGRSVGIVGAGPGGLAAAERLREAGFRVEIYDRYDRPGGLLIYGIPNFKLDKATVVRRTERLREAGVVFHTGVDVGRDVSLDALRARHDAVVIAVGVYKARELDCPIDAGVDAPAMAYLTASNRNGLGDAVPAFDDGRLNADGKRVVVIGGGDTAMDCVRTAVRQGAASVTCLYRRDRANMPGSAREVAHAEEEGVVFEWLAAPKAVGAVVNAARMRLGPPDASGRRAPVESDGARFDLAADMAIKALGYSPEDVDAMFGAPGLKTTARGTIAVDGATMETSLPNVYAVGDVVRGASLVVWAIRDGQTAAAAIAARLGAEAAAPAHAAE
ncbi:MAG: NAD(P)-dependent oxidoreductase [Parvularculaceae bacterium]